MPSCPGQELWRRDFSGSSGVFSIVFDSRYERSDVLRIVDSLELFRIGDEPNRPNNPYGHRLVRLSIGLEDPRDPIADLEEALA